MGQGLSPQASPATGDASVDRANGQLIGVRTGNFFADLITYKQRTETKGWRFNALILYVDDMVVYRSWGGQPKVDELDVATRPLGPFQEMGPASVSAGR